MQLSRSKIRQKYWKRQLAHRGRGALGAAFVQLVLTVAPLALPPSLSELVGPSRLAAQDGVSQTPAKANRGESAQSLALGSGMRAGQSGTAAALQNSANMAVRPAYLIESINYYDSSADQWSFGGVVMDSVTARLSAGVSFRGVTGPRDESVRGIDAQLALAYAFIEQFALGVTGRYVLLEDRSDAEGGLALEEAKGFTFDASMRISPLPGLNLVALAYNVLDRSSSLTPRTFGGSVAYSLGGVLTLGGDFLADIDSFSRTQYITGGGLEWMFGGFLPLRAGYRADTGRRAHAITAGIGYVGEMFSIETALRQDVVNSTSARDTMFLLSAAYRVR